MGRKPSAHSSHDTKPAGSLAGSACPNPDCSHFNRFDAANLSVVEGTGKNEHIRRLYCSACERRFTERQGTLLRYSELPEETVVRIAKCPGHGCSVEAAADICDVDPRAVDRIHERAGRRAEDFHRLRLDKLDGPPEAVRLDELHGRVGPEPAKKGSATGRCSAGSRRSRRVMAPGIGTTVNTSHLGRPDGTPRCQQTRLARRPRRVSRGGRRLQWSLWLWRDLDNRVRVHGSLEGRTPAMAAGLSERVRSVPEHIRHPLHADDLTHAVWAEEREKVLTSTGREGGTSAT
jgi:transposase-like protein